ADELRELEGFGEKSVSRLLAAIDGSRQTTLARFLYALGIRDVGEATAQTLARHFGSLREVMSAEENTLQEVPDIGPKVASRIAEFFREAHNRGVIERLLAAGVEWEEAERADAGPKPLEGQTFVLTGSLE